MPYSDHDNKKYVVPALTLLESAKDKDMSADFEEPGWTTETITQKLAALGVYGKVVEIIAGPVITRCEFMPIPGTDLNRIMSVADDLALALRVISVRIEHFRGKSAIGIEIPCRYRKSVYFKDIVSCNDFCQSTSRLTLCLGANIAGTPVVSDLASLPHLLVAGTTGAGKSSFINTAICSILFKATPKEVRFLLIDPKGIELTPYKSIPHLLQPVIFEPGKAVAALRRTVEDMERRHQQIAEKGMCDILQYNKKIDEEAKNGMRLGKGHKRMAYIVVIIDELADLMRLAARAMEGLIALLARMGSPAGIHLIVATQRPSVDVITPKIKTHFSSRISFQVLTKLDSHTIIDSMAAVKLLGKGDMLFQQSGTLRLQRIHGTFISEKEIRLITNYAKTQNL